MPNTQLTYDNILATAEEFAAKYRSENKVPALPSVEDLASYKQLLEQKYAPLIERVKAYTAQFDLDLDHGFEHLAWVSALAGWISNHECDRRGIVSPHKNSIIEQTVLAGLLHDIDRHLGFGEAHQVQGAQTTQMMFDELGIVFPKVVTAVGNHDKINYDPGDDQDLAIIVGSVFDADHFMYGLEREGDVFWRSREKNGVPATEVIHQYEYLPQYLHAWKTAYGKEVGPQFLAFGIAIAEHIEQLFSN